MKKMKKTKRILLLALVVAILACGVGGTIAYLITNTGSVVNTFQPAYVTSQVNEDFNNGGTTKSNVTITNTGNVSAYIRAAIVITWKDAYGKTMPAQPVAGTDYTLSINTTDWTKGQDGYYYYTEPVAANGTTSNLIVSCTENYTDKYNDGRKLCVEVIGSAIQSEGMGVSGAQAAFTKAADSSKN